MPGKRSSEILASLVAAALLKERKRAGLTQEALAARAGISWTYIHMIERGQREPSFGVIEHLSDALGLRDPRRLFAGKLSKKGKPS